MNADTLRTLNRVFGASAVITTIVAVGLLVWASWGKESLADRVDYTMGALRSLIQNHDQNASAEGYLRTLDSNDSALSLDIFSTGKGPSARTAVFSLPRGTSDRYSVKLTRDPYRVVVFADRQDTILVSNGPDRAASITSEIKKNELLNLTYNPTNGTFSSGDIWMALARRP